MPAMQPVDLEKLTRTEMPFGKHKGTLLADLPVSRTPWEQALRTRLAGALGDEAGEELDV